MVLLIAGEITEEYEKQSRLQSSGAEIMSSISLLDKVKGSLEERVQ